MEVRELTLLLYYSFSGSTEKLARQVAAECGADLVRVEDTKPHGKLWAFIPGCPKAMGHKTLPIKPLDVDFSRYDSFIVMAPIWAGNPAPPINNVFDLLPKGSQVALRFVSGGGSSSREATTVFVESKGLHVADYQDIKAEG